jgi:hypothetical protein
VLPEPDLRQNSPLPLKLEPGVGVWAFADATEATRATTAMNAFIGHPFRWENYPQHFPPTFRPLFQLMIGSIVPDLFGKSKVRIGLHGKRKRIAKKERLENKRLMVDILECPESLARFDLSRVA